VKEVRAFVGLASYYRRFVQNFAEIAAPLHELMKKGVKIQVGGRTPDCLREVKQILVEAPILVTPDDEHEYVVDTDASNLSMGAVLSIVIDGQEHVVAYASRVFSVVKEIIV